MTTAVIDISEAAQCAQAVHECVTQFARLDALINSIQVIDNGKTVG